MVDYSYLVAGLVVVAVVELGLLVVVSFHCSLVKQLLLELVVEGLFEEIVDQWSFVQKMYWLLDSLEEQLAVVVQKV